MTQPQISKPPTFAHILRTSICPVIKPHVVTQILFSGHGSYELQAPACLPSRFACPNSNPRTLLCSCGHRKPLPSWLSVPPTLAPFLPFSCSPWLIILGHLTLASAQRSVHQWPFHPTPLLPPFLQPINIPDPMPSTSTVC
jgi:hypothetical protein